MTIVLYSHWLSRLLSVHGLTLILVCALFIVLFFDFASQSIFVMLLVVLIAVNVFRTIAGKKMDYIVNTIIFNDDTVQVSYYTYGFVRRSATIAYTDLQYWVVSYGRFHKRPYGIQIYNGKELVAGVVENRLGCLPGHIVLLVHKFSVVGKVLLPSTNHFITEILEQAMSRIFSLKPVNFKKYQRILILLVFPLLVTMYLFLTDSGMSPWLYLISSCLLLFFALMTLYVNRYEISTLAVSDDSVALDYYNKSFMKLKPYRGEKSALTPKLMEDRIELYSTNEKIGVIRKAALTAEEWDELRGYWMV